MKNVLILVGIVFIIGICIWKSYANNKTRIIKLRRETSGDQLKLIATAVAKYQEDNAGQLPTEIQALAKYVPLNDIFFAPKNNRKERGDRAVKDGLNLNVTSDYSLAVLGNEMLVYEKPGLWGDDIISVCFVSSEDYKSFNYSNLSIRNLTKNQLEQLLKSSKNKETKHKQ